MCLAVQSENPAELEFATSGQKIKKITSCREKKRQKVEKVVIKDGPQA